MKPGNYTSEKLYHQNKVHSMIYTLFIPEYFSLCNLHYVYLCFDTMNGRFQTLFRAVKNEFICPVTIAIGLLINNQFNWPFLMYQESLPLLFIRLNQFEKQLLWSINCVKLFLIGLIIILFFKTTIYQL